MKSKNVNKGLNTAKLKRSFYKSFGLIYQSRIEKLLNWLFAVFINVPLSWILIKLFKVNSEFLSPLSWKVVESYDMLRLVTKSTNVLVLKSSAAMNFKPTEKDYDSGYSNQRHMYNDSSQLIFLFHNKISQTTNNNLKYDEAPFNIGIEYSFKFDLITLHDNFMTTLIRKIIKCNTQKLLKIAKNFNKTNPVQKSKKEIDWDNVKEKEVLKPKNIINSQQFKDALEEEKKRWEGGQKFGTIGAEIENLIEKHKKFTGEDDTIIKQKEDVVKVDDTSDEELLKQRKEMEKEWAKQDEAKKEFMAKNYKN